MPRQIMNIGTLPTGKSAAQIGRLDYDDQSPRQCYVFKQMLERLTAFPL